MVSKRLLLPDDTKITVRNQATVVSDYSGDVQHKAWKRLIVLPNSCF